MQLLQITKSTFIFSKGKAQCSLSEVKMYFGIIRFQKLEVQICVAQSCLLVHLEVIFEGFRIVRLRHF